jgi:hypothetical protein
LVEIREGRSKTMSVLKWNPSYNFTFFQKWIMEQFIFVNNYQCYLLEHSTAGFLDPRSRSSATELDFFFHHISYIYEKFFVFLN